MLFNIWNRLPLKIIKLVRRWCRFAAWLIAIIVSFHHIDTAAHNALRAKVALRDLSTVKKLRICVADATADVGTLLGDGTTTIKAGFTAFIGYFVQNFWVALVIFCAILESISNFNKAKRWMVRWRRIRFKA